MLEIKKQDLSLRAISQQLAAMGSKLFDIGVRDEQTETMRNFEALTKAEVLRRVPWLKSENAKGKHVYVRPYGSTGLVLVDDISQDVIERMKREKVEPALSVETSPENYQVWVRLSQEPISEALSTMSAKILAKRYGGDIASADWKHFGRLSGMTNVKPEHIGRNGRYPFVKVSSRTGKMATRAPEILGAAARELQKALEEPKTPKSYLTHYQGNKEAPEAFYERLGAILESRYAPNVNYSVLDWMVAKSMLLSGYEQETVINVVVTCSKNLSERKGKYMKDYATRTVKKAHEKLFVET